MLGATKTTLWPKDALVSTGLSIALAHNGADRLDPEHRAFSQIPGDHLKCLCGSLWGTTTAAPLPLLYFHCGSCDSSGDLPKRVRQVPRTSFPFGLLASFF